MEKTTQKTARRASRHARIRKRVSGTATKPRLAVFRSNRFIYVQLINDETGVTLAAADSRKEKGTTAKERAAAVGTVIAEKAKKAGITKIVFDRGGFKYQGSIQVLADAARKEGLEF